MSMKAEYISHMGDDLAVVNAARVSFDKVSAAMCETDKGLIRYLAKHKHWTPFAHTSIQLRMSAPVPIRTQAFKHKTGFVENEESRRYISTRPEVFVPDEFRVAADNVKQGSGGAHPDSALMVREYAAITKSCVDKYIEWVEVDNVAPEQARFILPQGCIVNWIWTGNLASYARYYNQRTDSHAQKEGRDLAEMVADIIAPLYRVSWEALTK